MLIKDNKLLSVSNYDVINGHITIPIGIEKVADNAFINCTDLISIEIPQSVKEIGNNAFTGCINLKCMIIPHTVLSIGKWCFSKCKNLQFVKIEAPIDKLPYGIFSDCHNLKEVYLPNSIKIFDGEAFANCKSLSDIELPNNLELIGKGCFYNCVSLTNIVFPSSVNCLESNSFSQTGIINITIPKQVTNLPFGVFKDCRNLQNIIFHDNFQILGDNVFNGCLNLKEIILPNSLTRMENSVFSNCINLTQITIPPKIDIINSSTFSNCKSLTKINILGNIKEIGSFAFENCINLLSFPFKDGLNKISNGAFKNCQKFTDIFLPTSIKQVFGNIFNGCDSIKQITLSSSLTNATDILTNIVNHTNAKVYIYDKFYTNEDLFNIRKIRIKEMVDRIYKILVENNHIYNLNKEKIEVMYETNLDFKDIVDTMIYNSRLDNSNYEIELIKFDNLFTKTRFSNLPSGIIYDKLDNNLISKYNVKMLRKIKELDIFDSSNYGCESVIPSIISFFGLFEKDSRCYYRLKLLKVVLSHKYLFSSSDFLKIPSNIKQYFTKVSSKCFLLDDKVCIPDEFKDYLKRVMTADDVKNVRCLKNRYGKLINDFFKNNYSLTNHDIYILNENLSCEEIGIINNCILNSSLDNQITCSNLIEIFDGMPRKYNEEVLDFFIKNVSIILPKTEYRLKFKEIVSRYDEIKNYYLTMGNDHFSYHEAYHYLCESVFLNVHKGNYEFEEMVKKAGVTNQSKFEKYQELYETIKNKRSSIIPRIKEKFELLLDGKKYTLLGEMLRKDDPFSLLVGELSYTNCCQQINDNGYDCLVHAINDGRIFCTYLINDNHKVLLSQSWVWRNGNVICFDNIEGTNFMKKNILYSRLVAEIYKKVSTKIIEVSLKNKDKIDVIMVGHGHDDLKLLNEYFGEEKKNYVWPPRYYSYLDSSRVHYICGSEEEIDTSYEPKNLYLDERIFVSETGISITTKTMEKLGKINSKYKNIIFASELSDLLEISINNLSIIYGEDWYILYKVIDNNLSIIDSGMVELSNKKELRLQEKEILKAYKLFIKLYNVSPNIIDSINNQEKIYKK